MIRGGGAPLRLERLAERLHLHGVSMRAVMLRATSTGSEYMRWRRGLVGGLQHAFECGSICVNT